MWIGLILYLWHIENNNYNRQRIGATVVNWSHFVSLTYWKQPLEQTYEPLIVVNWSHFVSLTYWKQRFFIAIEEALRCELVSFCIFDILKTTGSIDSNSSLLLWIGLILYLWHIENNRMWRLWKALIVVNWSHFVSLTYWKQPLYYHYWKFKVVNWSHFVSLTYWKQLHFFGLIVQFCCELVSFCIFDILKTTPEKVFRKTKQLWIGLILYLWHIENNKLRQSLKFVSVVNWSHFVSLTYWKQHFFKTTTFFRRCELVSFCIFDILKTTIYILYDGGNELWIGLILYLWHIENNRKI